MGRSRSVHRSGRKGITVSFYDHARRESVSFTVYGADARQVASEAHASLSKQWNTTSLHDRRHKRR